MAFRSSSDAAWVPVEKDEHKLRPPPPRTMFFLGNRAVLRPVGPEAFAGMDIGLARKMEVKIEN